MSRATATPAWELVVGEAVVRVTVADGAAAAARWGLCDPGLGADVAEPCSIEPLDADWLGSSRVDAC